MLDAETKRRIDTCRDILVGKVPDPKSQVEQITIALIYKFMDDMDREAEELGGQRSFFAGDFARYGWAQLKAPELSGKEKLDRYADAIGKMNENPGIPALFRDIFKNAYLPYRDPETLRAFLKEIDGFTYDHSERLGDASEYLLSVLGSQGDAGQFRTPRHLIDFMVEVINPQKHESILDPACGTAGFLISAWKHILKRNTQKRTGDKLTPDERQNLAANIRGYDISPDMVRLSLVNLYLHGFTDPHIVEYDTLTSEERWNEMADVILANPPFMSPKGGIKPHKRFSVQATRSEVLFVDYMAEHLSSTGRAAIVVPEGIIFQSGTAYKKLREMLVKNALIAVVSLPAGVFNPYSGVKTSILILDKRRAKTCDSVLFVKVENDGFGLGAQRQAVTGSDLPEAKRLLEGFFAAPEAFENGPMAHTVARAKIGENGEWNLSGNRYTTAETVCHQWDIVTLDTICSKITDGSHNPPEKLESGELMLSSQNIFDNQLVLDNPRFISIENYERENKRTEVTPGDVLLTIVGTIGRSLTVDEQMPRFALQRSVAVLKPKRDTVSSQFLCRVIQSTHIQNVLAATAKGVAQKGVYLTDLRGITIPLPPLAIQQEIVAEIEGYQKIIDGARQVVENYRPRIDVQPDWPTQELGEACEIRTGKLNSNAATTDGAYPFFTCAKEAFRIDNYAFDCEAILLSGNNASGDFDVKHFTGKFNAYQRTYVITVKPEYQDKLTYGVLRYVLDANLAALKQQSIGGLTKYLTLSMITSVKIPLPPLETQRAIVAEIEAEQALVEANKQLIVRFEAKIKATIDRVWGDSSSAA